MTDERTTALPDDRVWIIWSKETNPREVDPEMIVEELSEEDKQKLREGRLPRILDPWLFDSKADAYLQVAKWFGEEANAALKTDEETGSPPDAPSAANNTAWEMVFIVKTALAARQGDHFGDRWRNMIRDGAVWLAMHLLKFLFELLAIVESPDLDGKRAAYREAIMQIVEDLDGKKVPEWTRLHREQPKEFLRRVREWVKECRDRYPNEAAGSGGGDDDA
jgi:hypothetical protein